VSQMIEPVCIWVRLCRVIVCRRRKGKDKADRREQEKTALDVTRRKGLAAGVEKVGDYTMSVKQGNKCRGGSSGLI
jgi:hypothetical protein